MKAYLPFILLALMACNSNNEKYYPEVNNIVESVYASVQISPDESYKVYANKTGIIDQINIDEGDTVQANELLFSIQTVEVENLMQDAELDLSKAQSDLGGEESLLKNLGLELDLAQKQLALDSINFKRQNRLWKQNIGSQLAYENAMLAFERSVIKVKSHQKQYAQTKVTLTNNYKKALNRLDQQSKTLKEYKVQAKSEGKVYQIFKEEGELIHPQEPFGEIGSFSNYKITMEIDEVDIVKLELGDTAIIRLDAYPEREFIARIQKIYPKKDPTTLTFKVEGKFTKPPPKLYNGLAGEANIIVGRRHNVITIPTEYLNSPNTVLTENGEQTIEIGLNNLEFVEVISGIDTSTALIKPENE